MIATIALVAMTMAQALGHELADHNAWTNESCKMGFTITDAFWDGSGTRIRFETDWDPPYLVALFAAECFQFPDLRFPLVRRQVSMKSAYIPGIPFRNKTVFAVVGKPDSMCAGRDWTPEEIERYDNRIATEKPELGGEDPFDEIWRSSGTNLHSQLIGDYVWVRFLPGVIGGSAFRQRPGLVNDFYPQLATNWTRVTGINTFYVTNDVTGMGQWEIQNLPDRFFETFTVTGTNLPSSFPDVNEWVKTQAVYHVQGMDPYLFFVSNVVHRTMPDDPHTFIYAAHTNVYREGSWSYIPQYSKGTGIRIVHFEDTDENFLKPAYSTRPNRSDEVVVRRQFHALDGSLLMDWLGRTAFTNDWAPPVPPDPRKNIPQTRYIEQHGE